MQSKGNDWSQILATSWLLPALLFIAIPIGVTWEARTLFTTTTWEFFRPFVLLFLYSGIAFSITLLLIYRFYPKLYSAIHWTLLSFATILLLEAYILVPDSSIVLDGNPHPLEIKTSLKFIEFSLILLVGVATIYASLNFSRHYRTLLGFTWLWMAVATMAVVLNSETKTTKKSSNAGELLNKFSDVSGTHNIFHIMFDSLQGDLIQEIFAENPEFAREFDGFTHFTENIGSTNWTTQSIVSIFTEKDYYTEADPEKNGIEELDRILVDNYLSDLKEKGYTTKALLPGNAFSSLNPDYFATLPVFSNELKFEFTLMNIYLLGEIRSEHITSVDLILYRLSPTWWKSSVYRNGSWLTATLLADKYPTMNESWTPLERDILLSKEFMLRYTKDLEVNHENPCYTFIHLYPPHRPHFLDRNGNPIRRVTQYSETLKIPKHQQRAQYKEESIYVFKLLVQFLQRLKKLDIYDSSDIIIQSDTGLGIPSTELIENGLGEQIEPIARLKREELIAYADAGLILKRRNSERTPLQRSSAPTSHRKTYSTILALAGFDAQEHAGSGASFFDIREQELKKSVREFSVGDVVRFNKPPPPRNRFRITGSFTDFENWQLIDQSN